MASLALGLYTFGFSYDQFFALDHNLLWQDGLNWTGGLPNSTTNVAIGNMLSPVLLTGTGSAQSVLISSGGLDIQGTLNVLGDFTADNQIVGDYQAVNADGLGSVLNIGNVGGSTASATNSVLFGTNSFSLVTSLIATNGGVANINANNFSYNGGFSYWSGNDEGVFGADGLGSQMNVAANIAYANAAFASDSGTLNFVVQNLSGNYYGVNSGTATLEADQSFSGSLNASYGGTVQLLSTSNWWSYSPTSVANNTAVEAQSGGTATARMGSYTGALSVQSFAAGSNTWASVSGGSIDVLTGQFSATNSGALTQVSVDGTFTLENSGGNSGASAYAGGVVQLAGKDFTSYSSASGQNVWVANGAGSSIQVSGTNSLTIDPADTYQSGFAGGNFFEAVAGGEIDLSSANVSIGANSIVELVGAGSTFTINQNGSGTENVYFNGQIVQGSEAGIPPGMGSASISGGNVQFGSSALIYGLGETISVNNADNALLNATNNGFFNFSGGGALNIGGATFVNNGQMSFGGSTAYLGQSTPGAGNTNPLVFTNNNSFNANGGATINFSGQIVNAGQFNLQDTGALQGDSNSLFTNSGTATFGWFFGTQGQSVVGTFDNSGGTLNLQLGYGLQTGTFTNELGGNTDVQGGSTLGVTGTLNALSGSTLQLNDEMVKIGLGPWQDYGGGTVNAGSLNLMDGGIQVLTESVLNTGAATINASSPTDYLGGSGGVYVQGGYNVTGGGILLQGYGFLTADQGGNVNVQGGIQMHDQSSIWVQSSPSFVNSVLTLASGDLELHDSSVFTGFTNSQTNINAGNLLTHDSSQVNLSLAGMTVSGNVVTHDNSSLSVYQSGLSVGGSVTNIDFATVTVQGNGGSGLGGLTVGGDYNENSGSGTLISAGAALTLTNGSLNVGFGGNFAASDAGTTVTVQKGSVNNSSYLAINNGANLTTSVGDFNNSGGLTVVDSISSINVGGNYNQTVDGAYTNIGGMLTVAGNYVQLGNGTTKVYGTLQATNVQLGDATHSGGTLGGPGTIIGNVNNISGTVNVGDPQTLSVIGDFTQGPDGTLILNVFGEGGVGALDGNDQLSVTGNLTLGGTLDIVFGNGYKPRNGASFDLFAAGSFGGSFSTIEETVGGVNYILAPGSLNLNGGVGTFKSQAVPEPSAFALLGLGLLGLLKRKRS